VNHGTTVTAGQMLPYHNIKLPLHCDPAYSSYGSGHFILTRSVKGELHCIMICINDIQPLYGAVHYHKQKSVVMIFGNIDILFGVQEMPLQYSRFSLNPVSKLLQVSLNQYAIN
jgi:hypothetical protein